MKQHDSQPPLSPDPPAPPGQDVEAPDLPVDAPREQTNPDGTAVSADAGTVEAPD